MKRTFLIISALIITMLALGTGLGLWVASERSERNSMFSRIERKAVAYLRSAFASEASTDSNIETNRLRLERRVFNMPLSVTDSGGGIAEAPGGGILLLDRLGNLFRHFEGQTTRLKIETPDNGLDDLTRQYATGDLGGGSFRARGFRFNDVLALERNGNTELFISYSDWDAGRLCYRNVLAHVTLRGATDVADWEVEQSDWRELKVTEPCLPTSVVPGIAIQGIEAGGRLIEYSATEVVWSSGVYELDDFFKDTGITPYAQRDESDYGRLLKIDFRTGETEALARGLRNPQGLTRSPGGRIWVTDHGMRGGDEVNIIEPGQPEYNFGWPFVTYGTHYDHKPVDASGHHAGHNGYDLPLVSFVPSVAPGAALFVGGFHPVWNGDVLVGSFRGTLERVHEVEGRAIYVETIPVGVRVRDMVMTPAGEIVLWTDNLQLIFLKPDTAPGAAERIFTAIDNLADNGMRQMVKDLVETCLQCHSLSEGEIQAGPSLHGVCGRQMGGVAEFGQYSPALVSTGRTWTQNLLGEFILDPQSVVPGTTMAWEGTGNAGLAATVAELICTNPG